MPSVHSRSSYKQWVKPNDAGFRWWKWWCDRVWIGWWYELIVAGPDLGYYPNAGQCWLVVKAYKEGTTNIFEETAINITNRLWFISPINRITGAWATRWKWNTRFATGDAPNEESVSEGKTWSMRSKARFVEKLWELWTLLLRKVFLVA